MSKHSRNVARALALAGWLSLGAGCEFPGSSSPITIVSKNSQQPQLSNPTIGAPIANPPGVQPPIVTTTTARPPVVTTTTARPPIVTTTTARPPAVTTTTASTPPSGELRPPFNPNAATNLPAGLGLVEDQRWISTQGWNYFGGAPQSGQSYARIVSDPTAPDGDSSVLENSYAGVQDAWDPRRFEFGFGRSEAIFITWIVKFSSSWEAGNSGIKWQVFANDGNLFNLGMRRYPFAPYNGQVPNVIQLAFGSLNTTTPVSTRDNPTARVPVFTGEWYKIQLYVELLPVGRFRLYVNDVLAQDFLQDWGSNTWVEELRQSSTYGGGNVVNPAPDMRVWYDRTVIWRR